MLLLWLPVPPAAPPLPLPLLKLQLLFKELKKFAAPVRRNIQNMLRLVVIVVAVSAAADDDNGV